MGNIKETYRVSCVYFPEIEIELLKVEWKIFNQNHKNIKKLNNCYNFLN